MRRATFFGYLTAVLLVSIVILLPPPDVSGVASAQSPEDLEFQEWYSSTMAKIETDTAGMATAIENYDCTSCETWARSGYEDATKALTELEGYAVSAEMQPVKDHLKLALENFKSGCQYAESGAMAYDADELETANSYFGASSGHFEMIDELELVPPTPITALRRLQGDLEGAVQTIRGGVTPSPTPTPQAPSYNAILAVGSLLAVAYLVLRRTR